MIRIVPVVVLLVAMVALAQDATAQVNEVDVIPLEGIVDVLPDGGCMLTGIVQVQFPSVEPKYDHFSYPLGAVRCAIRKSEILAAGKLDMRRRGVLIGDAGSP